MENKKNLLDKELAIATEISCIMLINNFCNLFVGEEESIEETYDRFVGFPDSDKGYNPCEIFELADMFINLHDVFQFYILNCSVEEFTNWYWSFENTNSGKRELSLKHWLLKMKIDKKEIKRGE